MPAKKEQQPGPARRRNVNSPTVKLAPTDASHELNTALAEITKIHGEGTIVRGDKVPMANHSPTGAFMLDLGLCGGFAEGYATMIYGYESSGKTLVALLAAAGYQRKHPDKVVVFVDAEKLYDPLWAAKLGVDTKRMMVITPDTGEQAVDGIRRMLEVDVVGLVILDSIPTCVPKAVDDRSAEDKTMGALAALMGILCSKIVVSWGKERKRDHRVSVILLNQWRMKIGFVLGDPRTLPGGRQINHLPTTKVAMKGKEAEGESEGDDIHNSTELSFKFDKTKHGKSINEGSFTMVLGDGHSSGLKPGQIDDTASVVLYAFKFGIATGGGGKFKLADFTDLTFRKKTDIVDWMRREVLIQKYVRAAIIAAMRLRHGLHPFPPDDNLEGVESISRKLPKGLVERIAHKAKIEASTLTDDSNDDEEDDQ